MHQKNLKVIPHWLGWFSQRTKPPWLVGGFPSWPCLIRGEQLFCELPSLTGHSKSAQVIFPIAIPDEGTFDWLDDFLKKNPRRTGGPWAMSPGSSKSLWSDKVAFWTKKAHLTEKTQSGRCRYIYYISYIYNVFFGLVFWVGLKCKESLENIIRDTCLSNICHARNHCSCGFWDVLGVPS